MLTTLLALSSLSLSAWLGSVSYLMLNFVVLSGLIQWMTYKSIGGGGRSFLAGTTSTIGNVLGLVILATTLCAAWSILPRRNVDADLMERDGARFDDPARTSLKRPSTSVATGPASNPFGSDPVPPRRPTVERETF